MHVLLNFLQFLSESTVVRPVWGEEAEAELDWFVWRFVVLFWLALQQQLQPAG